MEPMSRRLRAAFSAGLWQETLDLQFESLVPDPLHRGKAICDHPSFT